MTQTTIRTLDGVDVHFGSHVNTSLPLVAWRAQMAADANGAPVGVWSRDGWHTACEIDPESLDTAPESLGWTLIAVIDPQEAA